MICFQYLLSVNDVIVYATLTCFPEPCSCCDCAAHPRGLAVLITAAARQPLFLSVCPSVVSLLWLGRYLCPLEISPVNPAGWHLLSQIPKP